MRKLIDKNFKIFVDFDGTITKTDVGEALFLVFGDADESRRIIERWINKEITSIESWQLLCKTVKDFDENEFDKFLTTIEIDNSFHDLVKYCKENEYDIYVLSDGLDYYIKKILKREGLSDIKVFSNHLEFSEKMELIPSFPYTDEECKRCANCKRNHIIENSDDDDFTVYIGDGYSDTCAAQYTDFIFAKSSLLKFCEINRISFFPFDSFTDVIKRIESLGNKKRLKKRHQAELKRREVYLQG
jgi:2,3-diketo-5-methylthio-1-phosphopentane phosphatase